MRSMPAARCRFAGVRRFGRPGWRAARKKVQAKILSASFRQWVRPGDEVLLHAEITASTDSYANAECRAEVNGQAVAQAKLFFSFMPIDSFAAGFRDVVLDEFLAGQAR